VYCGVRFTKRRSSAMFCGNPCKFEHAKTGEWYPCECCGLQFWRKHCERGRRRMCSPSCMWKVTASERKVYDDASARDRAKYVRKKSIPRRWLACVLRSRINSAIKHEMRSGSAVKLLGCSVDECVAYLESKFLPGMTWQNWGLRGWHLDHIRPLASFDLANGQQFSEACHYTNLQPLWAKDNLAKGSRA